MLMKEAHHASNRLRELLPAAPNGNRPHSSVPATNEVRQVEQFIGGCLIAERLTRAAVCEYREFILLKPPSGVPEATEEIREMFAAAVRAFAAVVQQAEQLLNQGANVGRRDELATTVRKVQESQRRFEEMVEDAQDPNFDRKVWDTLHQTMSSARRGLDWRQDIFGKDA
jgi:hypothetical protein